MVSLGSVSAIFPLSFSPWSSNDIDFTENAEMSFIVRFKAKGMILDDSTARISFDLTIFLDQKEYEGDFNKSPILVVVGCEAMFDFEGKLDKVNKVGDLPFFPNLLAVMFPYMREKVTTAFGNNQIEYYLPSFNLIEFAHKNADKIEIKDLRNS